MSSDSAQHVVVGVESGRVRDKGLVLLDVLCNLLERWRAVAAVTAAAAITGVALALLLPPHFRATARLLPPQQEPSAAMMLGASMGNLSGIGASSGVGAALGLKNPNDMYIGLLKSRSIADRVIAQFHLQSVYHQRLASGTRAMLARNTNFQSEKEGLISISVTDNDRNRAAGIANAYIAALDRKDDLLALSSAAQRRRFFQAQVDGEKDALAKAEADLKQTQESTGVVQLSGQAEILLDRIAAVRAAITSHLVELQALRNSETTANPETERLESETQALEGQLRVLQQTRPGESTGDATDVGSHSLPGVGLEYSRRLREVKYHESLLEMLAKQYAAARMDEVRSSPQVRVVDYAEPPDRKAGPSRLLLVIGFTAAGLLLSCAYFLFRDVLAALARDQEVQARMLRVRASLHRTPRARHA